jgi:uncharacterized protein YutE (UPF0331/DUF86 family)
VVLKPDVLRALLLELDRAIGELERLAALPAEAYLADPDRRAAGQRHVQVAAQVVIDVALHILASRFREHPTEYAPAIRKLGEVGIIDGSLAARLEPLGRLRNLLVHVYWRIDDGRLLEDIRAGLPDLEAFLAAIESYATREEKGA